MNHQSFLVSFFFVLSLMMTSCSKETISSIEVDSKNARSCVHECALINLPQNPIYILDSQNADGVYSAMPTINIYCEYLKILSICIRVPRNITLTGISFTSNVGSVLCGEFSCDKDGIISTSPSANNQLFVEFKNPEGDRYVELKQGDGLQFSLPIAPDDLEKLVVCLHGIEGSIYKADIDLQFISSSDNEIIIDEFIQTKGNQWMTLLDDQTPIVRLSLPGTHDAATGNGMPLSLGVTQSLSLQEQWDLGIRVFDFRPGYKKVRKGFMKYENELHIYHGIVESMVSFDEAMKVLMTNLERNPDEFAIVLMQFENASLIYNDRNVWNSLMNDYLINRLPQRYKINYRPDLTLGEVRGKLLILSRDKYADLPVTGGFIDGWSFSENGTKSAAIYTNDGSTYPLYVQDCYKVANLETKCNALKQYIDSSAMDINDQYLTINHASGYTLDTSYPVGVLKNAQATNSTIYNYLTSDVRMNKSAGIIMMDRVGVRRMTYAFKSYEILGDLATQTLINNNFKCKLAN